LTFEGAKLSLGKQAEQLADYFDACRRKRNEIDYTGATIATTTEADELVFHAKSFLKMVEEWIETTHSMCSAEVRETSGWSASGAEAIR
jgi:hypothetical protein